ncbi:MAG: glutathione S-transferase [Alphaproteobacteria bacterium]|nr:glutathione S-transferase [Alphaproteobacteria bacterium]MCW5741679.1 glutathione S-transferase [Alphaproteobacteria bacterium]
MKLLHSPSSPYVRKALVLAKETGLDGKIETVTVTTTPIAPASEVSARNPVAKIPALTDGAMTLYDSPVICEYLDSKHRKRKLFPAKGKARWTALRQQALGDGLLDAALLARYEDFLRPADKRWPEWSAGQMAKINGALDAMEKEAGSLKGALTIGHISFGCALGYLDFRFADLGWRDRRRKLAAWYAKFAQRPSMKTTMPPG